MLGGKAPREARATRVTVAMKQAGDLCKPDPRFSLLFGKWTQPARPLEAHLWLRALPDVACEEWMRNLCWVPRTCLQVLWLLGLSCCPMHVATIFGLAVASACGIKSQSSCQVIFSLVRLPSEHPAIQTACYRQGVAPTAQCSSIATRMGRCKQHEALGDPRGKCCSGGTCLPTAACWVLRHLRERVTG